MTYTKIAAAVALAVMASGAQAAAVTGMTLGDTMTLAGVLGTDGYEGTFKFNALSAQNANGASQFKGDVNGGVIDVTAANAWGSFTTGFLFTGAPFVPDTTGPIDIDITGTTMTVNSLPWGGYFTAAAFQFNMPNDAAPTYTLIQTGADTYAYRMKFNHVITATDDPSGTYVDFNAFWILEGTMTTAVPEASTYGMMLAGLGLVGAAVRRRRTVI
ncbi:PEP-CTERM sorting domain-containing protein [Thiobacillus sp.]|uniref:PEP-CTERM sorting domain-containing protein n=1 Tax=Thiobacillus sp. TaxID=924 RepID=UPI00286DCF4A|nr:PEP-CTERM sorting domain-containing protein [Thiobacillus sp.]